MIENMRGAPLIEPVMLRGGMFDVHVSRHRYFESSFPIAQPAHPRHTAKVGPDY